MKNITVLIISILASMSVTAADAYFTVLEVGASRNTDTIILDVAESIPGLTCNNDKLFQLNSSDPHAEHFLSISLAALATGMKLKVGYTPGSSCANYTTKPTYWLIQDENAS